MTEPSLCPECGREIPSGSPAGLCPKCLVLAGLESQPAAADPKLQPTQPSPPPSASSGFIPPTAEELATRFPQLEILELLGRGGMGAVYKARQRELDRLVAVKILPPEVSADPAFAERFTREARALARLSHPNIVAVYDFGRTSALPSPTGRGTQRVAGGEGAAGEGVQAEGQLFYFIMEYVDGVNLRQAILSGGMSPKEALAIVPQICDALQFAHDEGIVHRDVKPENLLLDKRGRVKIADFGLAKLLGQAPGDVSLTATQQVMGTLRYMAPEQLEGTKAVDHRADIYSLGVVFYELLTGELPIGRFAPPSKKVEIDVRLDEVVLRALEKEPEQRYQHASEVKIDVESIGRSEGAVVKEKPTASAPSREAHDAAAQLNAELRPLSAIVACLASILFLVPGLLTIGVGLLRGTLENHLFALAVVPAATAGLVFGLLTMRPKSAMDFPRRLWLGSLGLFFVVWLVTVGLLYLELPGLVGAGIVFAATAYFVARWWTTHMRGLQQDIDSAERTAPLRQAPAALLMLFLGFAALAPVLYRPWDSESDYQWPSRGRDTSLVTDFKGTEHRLVRPLKAFQDLKTRVVLLDDPDHARSLTGHIEPRKPQAGFFRLIGSILVLGGVLCAMHTKKYKSSWACFYKPAVLITLAVLGSLAMLAFWSRCVQREPQGGLSVTPVPFRVHCTSMIPEREVRCNANIDEVTSRLQEWAKEHGYLRMGHYRWIIATVPDDRPIGAVGLSQFGPFTPWSELPEDMLSAWGGSPRPTPRPRFDVRCVASKRPAETIVTIRSGSTGAPRPAPVFQELLDSMEAALLAQ